MLEFILREGDKAAPVAIRTWIYERVSTGKNKMNDPEIIDAYKCAEEMEKRSGAAYLATLSENPL